MFVRVSCPQPFQGLWNGQGTPVIGWAKPTTGHNPSYQSTTGESHPWCPAEEPVPLFRLSRTGAILLSRGLGPRRPRSPLTVASYT